MPVNFQFLSDSSVGRSCWDRSLFFRFLIFVPFMEHFEHPEINVLYFLTFPPFFFFLSVFLSLVFPFQLFITFPHTSIYWRHFKVSANWMLPGQENNRSPAICWKDLAAAGFHIRPAIWKQTAQFISALKALWLGQWLLNFGLHTSHFFFRQISFLPWVSLWFPCLFAGRWCHPVSE